MNRTKTIEELKADAMKAVKRECYYENQLKVMDYSIAKLTRSERTHRLCSHGGMLERFLERPDVLKDEQIIELLELAFRKKEVQETLQKMIKEAEMETQT